MSSTQSPEKCGMSLTGLVTGSNNSVSVSQPAAGGQPDLATPCTPGEPLAQLHHKQKGHSVFGFSAMNRMRINGQLCDVKLKSGMVVVQAHKLVLAAVSPYFHAMFNDDMAEKTLAEITIHDVDPLALTLLVDFAYTGELAVCEDNVQVLLPASSILQMTSVREACCKFLMRQLHPTNCLGIRNFADTHSCRELHKRSHKFALENFQEVMNTEEFLLLPFQEVEVLISSGHLNIEKEELVFKATVAWIKHEPPERKKFIFKLLKHVRLPLMSREFLMNYVDKEPLVRETPECKELLLEAMRYHLMPEHRGSLTSYRTSHRQPEGTKPYLFAIGGGSLFAIHSECEVYNPRTDRWSFIASMNTRRSRTAVATVGNLLYAVGGFDSTNDLASAECFNPQINKWTEITPMGTKRSCLGACTLDGLIYCCGGYDGQSCLATVERYDPLNGVWTSCPAMNTRRRYCRIAVLDNCIYALGGFDSNNYQSSVERLDARMGKWVPVPSMTSRRSSCGVAAMGDYLYCVGGNDGTMCLQTGEKFCPRRNSWEPISNMHSRRSTHELCHIDGMLFSIGGNDGSSSLNSIERYDAFANKWMMVTAMVTRRSSVGAGVLDCLNLEKCLDVVKTLD